jgi:hypothetical protein
MAIFSLLGSSTIFFERHAELNSKSRPLGTVFTVELRMPLKRKEKKIE